MRDLDLTFKTGPSYNLKWNPYRFKRVQKLSPANKETRVNFAMWVILHQADWSLLGPLFDPQEEVECNMRFNKVMVWSALIDDSVLTIRWMDEPHRPRTVTAESYLEMLEEKSGRR